jgi:hypothetical protein
MSMDYIRRTYGVPAKRGVRVQFTDATKSVQGTIIGSRGQYIRVRWDETGFVHTMHPTWMMVYLKPPNVRHERRHKGCEAAFGTSARWRG